MISSNMKASSCQMNLYLFQHFDLLFLFLFSVCETIFELLYITIGTSLQQ